MFKGQEDIFLAILRSIMWGTSVDVSSDVNWRVVLNLAARQKCLHAFSMWTKANRIATPYDKQLQVNVFALLSRHARLNKLAVDVISLLAEHDIRATLIKGYSIAGLYPDPDMRDFGDVDIYVGEEQYHRAAEIVTAAYPNAHWHSDIRGGIHYILVLDENQDRVVELHRVTMEFHDAKADTLYQDFTRKYLISNNTCLDIKGHSVPVPPAAYNALYVFMHAWHHFESTGVGFRQLADWALCLHHAYEHSTREEWQALCDEIEAILTALHMKTVWQTFGHVLVDELHLPAEEFPLYTESYQKRAKRLLKQLLRDGHGGRPAKFVLKDVGLMRCFPWERPNKNRLLQKVNTVSKMLFDAWQMGKLFPDMAWHELVATMQHAIGKVNMMRKLKRNKKTIIFFTILVVVGLVWWLSGDEECQRCIKKNICTPQPKVEEEVVEIVEDILVAYRGRSIDYDNKFCDKQDKQMEAAQRIGLATPPKDRAEAAKMTTKLTFIQDNDNYDVDSLTHSIPYLVPKAAAELERIGEGFADILQRNGLPHYRFYVTSVLRTQADVTSLQSSGNVNATANSCHCYGTTFDLAYMRFDKVSNCREYMHQDNLKLVLGQVLLNEQRAGNIYVKYEKKQACFHITVRK